MNLDAEWLYRRVVPDGVQKFMTRLTSAKDVVSKYTQAALSITQRGLARHHGEHGLLARTWPTGSMVLWVAVLLGLSLVLYYF